MKQSLFLLLVFILPGFSIYPLFSQSPQQSVPSYRFQVSSVKKATEKLDTEPFRTIALDSQIIAHANISAWENYIWKDKTLKEKQKSALLGHPDYPRCTQIEAASKGQGQMVSTYGTNSIAAAMVRAYADHRPLVLSPDMIWMLLLQGFSAHIETHPEEMRHYFVDFEGTKQLKIERNWTKGDPNNPWENVFEEFSDQIAKNTKDGLAKTCLPRFSTTGPLEKAAFDISLMRAMDHYFDYEVFLSCGIPEITLEGLSEDWALLEEHAAGLARYDLNWWIDPLKPILHEFTRASQGQVDTTFWQDMVKKREYSIVCSSQPFLTGWMLHFFPYVKEKPNPWLVLPDSVRLFEQAFAANEAVDRRAAATAQIVGGTSYSYQPLIVKPQQFGLPALEVFNLPNSMSKASVLLNSYGTEYDLEFWAGCIGIRQDETTLALRPEFGWRILDKGLHGQTPEKVYSAYVQAHVRK